MPPSNAMSPHQSPTPEEANTVTITCEDRWQVYHRLKELGIECQCGGFQPLTAIVKTPTEAMQLWSVVNRVAKSRTELAIALHKSWQLPCRH